MPFASPLKNERFTANKVSEHIIVYVKFYDCLIHSVVDLRSAVIR